MGRKPRKCTVGVAANGARPTLYGDAWRLTPSEARAVAALERLARRWPRALRLFSTNGTLQVLKPGEGRTFVSGLVTSISGIPNGGGDPDIDDEC